jgi:hypothetical protein
MVTKRFLAYLTLATFGLTGVYAGGKALLSGGGNVFTWLGVILGLPALLVGTLATARILYLVERGSKREER